MSNDKRERSAEMMMRLWSGKSKLFWLLTPLSLLYGLIVFIRKLLYQCGLFKSWKAPVPVIIVGNLSVGGNGKTPMVISLIDLLTQQGYRVGVVSRGYGGKSEHYPLIISDETTADSAGDEPILIYQRTHVPLAVSPKRSDAIKALLANHTLDFIITDDGLQHYSLKRDIEIVVIDGKRGFGNGHLLPAGPMRELPSRLNSVDFIIINGMSDKQFTHYQTYTMELKPTHAINLLTKQQKPVAELLLVHAMAGIGDPNRFFTMLASMKIDLIDQTGFADHQHYEFSQLQNLVNFNEVLLMTEKDAVKCHQFAQSNWWYLPIDAYLPSQFLDDFNNKISKLN